MELDAPEMVTVKMMTATRAGLKGLNAIVLSKSLAVKLFGGATPTNKTVKIDSNVIVNVTGVYEEFPDNTEFKNVTLMALYDLWLSSKTNSKTLQDDRNAVFIAVFVQIKPNVDFKKISARIKNVTLNRAGGQNGTKKTTLFLHLIEKWHSYLKF